MRFWTILHSTCSMFNSLAYLSIGFLLNSFRLSELEECQEEGLKLDYNDIGTDEMRKRVTTFLRVTFHTFI